MRFNALPQISVIKKEEKEARLKAFIGEHLSQAQSAAQGRICDRVLLLLARSHESPVVRALQSIVAEGRGEGIVLKTIVTTHRGDQPIDWPAELVSMTDCRLAGDPRLLDAHEQLWLDGETAWIGDCMRREPAKRDAFECYASGCEATARSAEKAFNRVWDKSSKVALVGESPAATAVAEIEPHIAGIAGGDTSTPTAATRH